MTVSTLRPNGITLAPEFAGAANALLAVNDNSDSSYIYIDSDSPASYAFGDLSLPAGAVIKSWALRARTKKATFNNSFPAITFSPSAVNSEKSVFPTTVSWTTPTTTTVAQALISAASDADIDALVLTLSWQPVSDDCLILEIYFDVTHVAKPVVAPSAPSGTVTTSNAPTVVWADTLDSDGGAQTFYEVRIFTAAQYGVGGFNPATSPATAESTVLSGAATSWSAPDNLDDGTYRAYVRVAQTVNGAAHWSDWAYTGFVIDVALPAEPLLYLTPEHEDGRVRIDVDDQAGDATTDALEIQRSLDNLTWEPVRLTTDTAGVVTGTYATAWDMEGGNGQTVYYRARALHDYSGEYAASAWVSDDTVWTEARTWWLKSPQHPSLNFPVKIHSQPSYERPARQGRFQALSARRAIVVSDTRGADEGSIVLRVDTDTAATALDDLLDFGGILLLQGSPQDKGWTDRYVVLGDLSRTRMVDKGFVEGTLDEFTWVEVEPPSGPIDEWPDEAS